MIDDGAMDQCRRRRVPRRAPHARQTLPKTEGAVACPRRRLYRPIFTHFVAEARRVVQDHAPPFCTMKLRTARGFRAGHRATSRRGFLGAFR